MKFIILYLNTGSPKYYNINFLVSLYVMAIFYKLYYGQKKKPTNIQKYYSLLNGLVNIKKRLNKS